MLGSTSAGNPELSKGLTAKFRLGGNLAIHVSPADKEFD